MINRRQINQLVFERNRRVSITMSAMKAGVSRNTARGMLEKAPELEAKALFEHLGERAEGGLAEKVLRTFQRRVRQLRLEHGKEKEVFFSQEARAGAVLAVDWTDMRDLGVSSAEVVTLLRTYEDEAMAFRERKAMPVSLEVYDDLLEGAL